MDGKYATSDVKMDKYGLPTHDADQLISALIQDRKRLENMESYKSVMVEHSRPTKH